MGFTKTLLASALVAQVSAQCSIKSGQISVIGPLADAWKLYNKQVSVNANIDEKIANATAESAAVASAIEAHHAGQATAAEGVHSGVVADLSVSHGEAVGAIGTKLASVQASIEAKYQAALTAAQEKHDARQANADANIAALGERASAADIASGQAQSEASNAAAAKIAAAQAKADESKAAIAAEAASGIVFTDARDAASRAKINAKHAASVLSLAQRYVEIHDKIEGTKFDTDATLAVLDNAGTEGGTPYAADCFVQASDAIEMVKAEMTPGEIWTEVVIGPSEPPAPTFQWHNVQLFPHNHQTTSDYCAAQGGRLATQAEICPNGDNRVGTPAHVYETAAHHWSPTSDGSNSWVILGYWTTEHCVNHNQIAGGAYGDPAWGTNNSDYGYDFLCVV